MFMTNMSDKTPKRPTNNLNTGFSPITLPESPAASSPQKNLTGLPRVVRDLAADIYNTIQRWNDLHIKGATVVKQIASIKAENQKDFSKDLEVLFNDLYGLVLSLGKHKDALVSYATQIKASEKLQKHPEPLFISLDIKALVELVGAITEAYSAEFNVKEVVLENLAYSKTKSQVMFLAALWTYQTKVTDEIGLKLEALLVETGHRRIT